MKTSFHHLALTGFALTLFTSLTCSADIVGTYHCTGFNPDNTQYKGTVKIDRKGEAYALEWTIGNNQHRGIGILTDGSLSVSWVINKTGDNGVVVYAVKEDGQLAGKWVDANGGKINSETLVPVR